MLASRLFSSWNTQGRPTLTPLTGVISSSLPLQGGIQPLPVTPVKQCHQYDPYDLPCMRDRHMRQLATTVNPNCS